MKWRRTWAVARKEFLHVVRDPGSLTMALATPALLLMLFGYALSLDVDNVPLAVWDQSGTERSRELISRFTGSRYFSLRYYVNNYADLVRGIDQGQVVMGLIVPRDFAQQVGAGHNAPVQLIVDGTDSNTATIAISYADVIAKSTLWISAWSRASVTAARGRPFRWTCVRGSGTTRTWTPETT